MPETTSQPKADLQAMLGLRAWQGCPPPMPASHRHNDLEINLVERGPITYTFGGQRVTFPTGALLLFWAIAPHRLVEHEPDTLMYWLTLPLAWFLHQKWPDAFRRAVLSCTPVVDEKTGPSDRALFQQWQIDLARGTHEERAIVLLEAEARLRRMALHQPGKPQPAPQNASLIVANQAEKMAAFLDAHFSEPVTVTETAQCAGLHPNYAMQVFRKTYGQTIIEYLTQCRIAYAQQLLVTTEQNILDIALQSGFGSVSQFYAAFKHLCGLSPRAYRQGLGL